MDGTFFICVGRETACVMDYSHNCDFAWTVEEGIIAFCRDHGQKAGLSRDEILAEAAQTEVINRASLEKMLRQEKVRAVDERRAVRVEAEPVRGAVAVLVEHGARVRQAPEAAELEVVFGIFEDGVDGVLPH